MSLEHTLSIIKPDAVERNLVGIITSLFETAGFRVAAIKKLQLTREQAEGFYIEHKEREFFHNLVNYMISSPVVVLVLEKQNAIQDYRTLIGATDPTEAKEGTIRRDFAESKERNSVHGSDSLENAKREIAYFFVESEIC